MLPLSSNITVRDSVFFLIEQQESASIRWAPTAQRTTQSPQPELIATLIENLWQPELDNKDFDPTSFSRLSPGPPRGPGESLEKDVESKSLIGKFLIKKLSICKFDTTLLSWQLQASKTTTKSRFRPGAEVAVVLADAAQDTAQDTVPLSKALALLRRPLHCPNSERIPNDP